MSKSTLTSVVFKHSPTVDLDIVAVDLDIVTGTWPIVDQIVPEYNPFLYFKI